MWQSVRLSHTILRFSLAIVFFWFGIDKFFHPTYWLNAWIPASVVHIAGLIHIAPSAVVYGLGVFEILVGISLAANLYIEIFAFLAVFFLGGIALFNGLNEVLVRDVGLMGGLLAIAVWPSKQSYKF